MDISGEGRPLQVISFDKKTNVFQLEEEALRSILLSPEVAGRPVSVVSIAGEFRQGKSFMQGFFLRYCKKQVSACKR